MPKVAKIYVGVGGWNFAPWRGSFYPKGLTQARELEYMSSQVTSIEINSTFYRLQNASTFAKWRDDTPRGFVFSVKAPRFVTHRKLLATAGSSVEKFLGSGVLELGVKLGAINWQLAPEKVFDAADVEVFLKLLPRKVGGRVLRHALEVRHASFDCQEFTALASKHKVAVVEAGDSKHPRIQARSAGFSYLRVMGAKAGAPKGYTPAALIGWRDHARELAKYGDVYLYFISAAKVRNPHAARALIEGLG